MLRCSLGGTDEEPAIESAKTAEKATPDPARTAGLGPATTDEISRACHYAIAPIAEIDEASITLPIAPNPTHMNEDTQFRLWVLETARRVRDLREARYRFGALVGGLTKRDAGDTSDELALALHRDADLLEEFMWSNPFCQQSIGQLAERVVRSELYDPIVAAQSGERYRPQENDLVLAAAIFDAEEVRRVRNLEDETEELAVRGLEPQEVDIDPPVLERFRERMGDLADLARRTGDVAVSAARIIRIFGDFLPPGT